MSFQLLRRRVSSGPVVTADLSAPHGSVGVLPAKYKPQPVVKSGAASRIFAGIFGVANNPAANLSAEVDTTNATLYRYHEGDLFTPGAQNYVFEYPFEFPLQTIWGIGFLRTPNTFSPYQPMQKYSNPNVVINGVGGLQAGQIVHQPLESTGQ